MLEEFIKSLSEEQKRALLESINNSLSDQPLNETIKQKSKTIKKTLRNVDLDFTVDRREEEQKKTRTPVTEMKRFNSFQDDGSESKGEEFETPNIKPTERRRPSVNKVAQTCSKCRRSVETHPAHARDWFICDKCIGAK